MSPTFRIAVRFLTARKSAMLMSLSCIVLGVGLFAATQATTGGFQGFFKKTMLGTDGAIRIQDEIQTTYRMAGAGTSALLNSPKAVKLIEGVQHPEIIINSLRDFPNFKDASAVVAGAVGISSTFKDQAESVQAYGVVLSDHLRVSDLAAQIVDGSIAGFEDGPSNAIIGRLLADRHQMQVGDFFNLEGRASPREFRVVAIHQTGLSDIDGTRVYINIGEARSLLGKPTGATYIQVSLTDPERAEVDAQIMQDALNHSVVPWQKRQESWLSVFHALQVSTGVTVSLFTLIAGIAMYNTLALVAMEKTKDIAILRSMGYTRPDITRIFLWQAAMVLCVGIIAGTIAGAALTLGLSHFPIRVTGIFRADRFLVQWSLLHYIEAAVTATVIVMLASLLPARRAARLEPGDVVRGTAQ